MAPKKLLKDADVGEAVDALLAAFAIPPEQNDLDAPPPPRPQLDGAESSGVAPSAEVGALWGAPKPRKR